jgi:hypothetical protein
MAVRQFRDPGRLELLDPGYDVELGRMPEPPAVDA